MLSVHLLSKGNTQQDIHAEIERVKRTGLKTVMSSTASSGKVIYEVWYTRKQRFPIYFERDICTGGVDLLLVFQKTITDKESKKECQGT